MSMAKEMMEYCLFNLKKFKESFIKYVLVIVRDTPKNVFYDELLGITDNYQAKTEPKNFLQILSEISTRN